jgi:replicative DNA helicase
MKNLTNADYLKEFAIRQTAEPDAVPTPFDSLNRVLRDEGGGIGTAKGWVGIIAANPGHFKSVLGINFCAEAMKRGMPTAYVSLEMSDNQIASRAYAVISGQSVAMLETGSFSPKTFELASGEVRKMPPLYCPESVSTQWEDVVDFVKECHEEHEVDYFVLDYIQLTAIGGSENIVEAISNVTTDLRAWAVNNRVCVIILSQFNRRTSSDYTQSPRSQGLHGSQVLEASADWICLVDHSRVRRDRDKALFWLLLDKNRHGVSQISIPVEVSYNTLRARECMEDELNDFIK